jgi:hypothetical protein
LSFSATGDARRAAAARNHWRNAMDLVSEKTWSAVLFRVVAKKSRNLSTAIALAPRIRPLPALV